MKPSGIVFSLLALLSLPSCGGKKEMIQEGVMKITVTQEGFEPSEIRVKPDQSFTLEFTRTTDKTCITGVIFPKMGANYELPLNQTVQIPIQVKAGEEIEFNCPMNMYSGKVVGK